MRVVMQRLFFAVWMCTDTFLAEADGGSRLHIDNQIECWTTDHAVQQPLDCLLCLCSPSHAVLDGFICGCADGAGTCTGFTDAALFNGAGGGHRLREDSISAAPGDEICNH